MISRLSREGLSLEMKDLFANPQIKSLSRYVKAETDKSASYETVEGEVLLTPIQQEYFSLNKTDRNHYNHAVILYRKNGFDESIVKRVFREIIQHHDALRTVFREEGGKIIQYNRGPGKSCLTYLSMMSRAKTTSLRKCTNWQRSFSKASILKPALWLNWRSSKRIMGITC